MQNELKRDGPKISWVPQSNFHITLQYLGEQEAEWVDEISGAASELLRHLSGFNCEVSGLGQFGGGGRPQVIWVGVPNPPELMFDIHHAVSSLAKEGGVKMSSQSFHPHITLGRVRSSKGAAELTSRVGLVKNAGLGSIRIDRCIVDAEPVEFSRRTIRGNSEFSIKTGVTRW